MCIRDRRIGDALRRRRVRRQKVGRRRIDVAAAVKEKICLLYTSDVYKRQTNVPGVFSAFPHLEIAAYRY